jgi:hypothetical protein
VASALIFSVAFGIVPQGVCQNFAQSSKAPSGAQSNAPSSSVAAKSESVVYEVVELPLRPLAISDSEWVAGVTLEQRAVRWNSRRGLELLPLPPDLTVSESVGINSKGEAVGTASTADSARRAAFIFREGKVVLLAGEQSRVEGMNKAGEIVGQAKLPGQKAVGPVVWRSDSGAHLRSSDIKNGDFEIIDLKICCAGKALAINGNGLIIGETYDDQGRYHAFAWNAGPGARRLDVPGEEYSSAIAVNDRGEVVVRATPGGLLLYSGGKFIPIKAAEFTPHALSRDGVVVGSVGSNPEEQIAFLWDQIHGMRDLNAMIPANSGWALEVASGVNDRGEIVGWGDHNGKEDCGFLLRPVQAARAKP